MSVLFAAAAIGSGELAAGQPTAPAAVDRSATVAEMEQGLPENSRVWLVDQGNPRADDAGAGTAAAPLRTIQAAAEQAEPGDLVLVGEGTYRDIVRNNVISDNGLCGIAGWSAKNCRIYNNLLEPNNRLSFSKVEASWEEWGAIKLHETDAVIAGNRVRDNEAAGIWIDNGYHMSRITGNVAIGNRLAGIKMELGAGSALIDNNIVGHTRDGGFYDGNGIYSHDAAGLTVAHNLLFENAGAGVLMRTITGRTYAGKPVETSNNRIVNNVFYNNAKVAISLPFENPRSSGNFSDHNLFVGPGAFFSLNKYQDTFTWKEVWAKLDGAGLKLGEAGTDAQGEGQFRRQSLDAWRAVTGWDRNSVTAGAPGGFLHWSVLPHRMLLRMNVPPEWPAMRCPAVDEMTVDFRGKEMATDAFEQDLAGMTALPGPFQELAAGRQERVLTPLRYAHPPALRASTGARDAAARTRRFERLQAAVPPPAANERSRSFSLADATNLRVPECTAGARR